ncbi:hypothetical protein [Mycobacterium sp. ACS4331]|uniref:hypothetical protein n=1 Tax=Mycobacterium sp. ACS4331 TaxID=1834121 RepID=UPI0009EF0A7C|nr:hypothetical protein [Mycobacterium sp. ACS4331]
MLNLNSRTRRVVVAGGFALALSAAPAAAILVPGTPAATPVAACPAGEVEDLYTLHCIPSLSPNVRGGLYPTVSPNVTGEPNGPGLESVPCPGSVPGECLERTTGTPGATAGNENLHPGADTQIGGEDAAR